MKKIATRELILCALFVALIALGAFIRIPLPPVPITLQSLMTMLAGLLLGGRLGCVSVLIYVFMGLAGLPVFSGGGGLAYVFQPSFGYLIGFAIAARVTGSIANKTACPSYKRLLAANFVGMGITYFCGLSYCYLLSKFYIGTPLGLWPLFLYYFIIFIPGDVAKCLVAAALAKRLIPILRLDKK